MGRGSKQTFSQMASRYMKWCSVLLIIKEMQHKTIVRHYLTPVRMTVIKKSGDTKWGCCEEETLKTGEKPKKL